ncbi:MAG: hypothetical protein ABIZ70_03925, partial [Gemmatimonadales bacterium]
AEIDAAVAGAVTGIPAPDRAAVQARAGEALYRPISLPTISAVVAGSDGTIWLGREVRAGSPRRWTLLDPRGEVVGDFTVPAAFEVRAGSATGLWGVEKDGDGVPRVVEMRVR